MSALSEYLTDYRRSIVEREAAVFREIREAYKVLRSQIEIQIANVRRAMEDESTEALRRRERDLLEVVRQIEIAIRQYTRRVAPIIDRERTAAATLGQDDAQRSVEAAIQDLAESLGERPPIVLPRRSIENAIALLRSQSPLAEYFEQTLAPAVVKAIREEILAGMVTSKPFSAIARAIRKSGDISRWRSLAVARTETLRIRRESALQVYRESDDIVQWEWVATKSERTCVLCLAMDGERFDLSESFPQHINCRCTMIAVFKDRPPIQRRLGRDWFDAQPPEIQQQILGPDTFAAWESGQIKDLKQLVGFRVNKIFGKSVVRRPLSEAILERN